MDSPDDMSDDTPPNLGDDLANATQSVGSATSTFTVEDLLHTMQAMRDHEPFPDNNTIYGTTGRLPMLEPDRHIDIFRWLTMAIPANYNPYWTIAPKTYERLRFLKLFHEPRRKLRKCVLRRIQARKRAWRKHRARVTWGRA